MDELAVPAISAFLQLRHFDFTDRILSSGPLVSVTPGFFLNVTENILQMKIVSKV